MKISVITPTAERASYLQGCYQLLKNQTYSNWEWLIYDTSFRPSTFSDSRVTYIHKPDLLSIGEKRNRLVKLAKGEIIVHFDDDDYYAPSYLENVAHRLKQASFCTAHAWFSYDRKTNQIFYWDTEQIGDVSYCVNSLSGMTVREIQLGPYMQQQREAMNYKGKTGYGFSFAYTKEVAEKCSFQDIDLAEDRHFFEEVEKAGFVISTVADQKGEAIHVLHDTNTSAEFPQFRIPHFLVQNVFQPFFEHMREIVEN